MQAPAAASLLRPGLLQGRTVLVSGDGAYAIAVREACGELGAEVVPLDADPQDEAAVAAALSALVREGRTPHALVIDAAGHFATAPADGPEPLRAALDASWVAARAAANAAWIEGEGGKLVLLAPPPGAGPHALATRAALENLARASSIEWSRYEIRPTALLPGESTPPAAVGALVAYLVSEAGDYFSGCAFSLDGPASSG
jgi:NAD(P)-dependent dehydrogenase (short-subunit alcohol dehydrogenase family)